MYLGNQILLVKPCVTTQTTTSHIRGPKGTTERKHVFFTTRDSSNTLGEYIKLFILEGSSNKVTLIVVTNSVGIIVCNDSRTRKFLPWFSTQRIQFLDT